MADVAAASAARRAVRFGLRWRFAGWFTLVTVLVMAMVAVIVSRELKKTLEEQIKQRGLALAHNLADSSLDPMQVKEERTLALMLLVKEYVQTGGSKEARDRLFLRPSLTAQIRDYVMQLGREDAEADVRNEGVLTAVVVDQTSQIVAYADAVTPPEKQLEWMEHLEHPYQRDMETDLLSPGEDSHIWSSRAHNGIFLIAVPIVPASGPMPGGPDDVPGTPGAAPPPAGAQQAYGTVYLTMSQGLVERTVARAVAVIVLAAAALVLIGALTAAVIAGPLTKPIRLLTRGVQAIADGNFGERIALKRRDELGDLTDAFNEMAHGLQEREVMRGAFSTYVSKDLLQEIMKNPDAMRLGGSRKEATVMFTLFGNHYELPALMARLDPEAIVRIINDYLDLQAKLVLEYRGHLDKFVGEEVVAAWGAMTPVPDHASLAVRCAVAIQRAVAQLNERRARQGTMSTGISIGINTGSMVAGNMGSQDGKREYTVIGADVNFAARLAGAGAKIHENEIWIGESTYGKVKDEVELKEKIMFSFKGIAEPQPVYVVAGVKAAAATTR